MLRKALERYSAGFGFTLMLAAFLCSFSPSDMWLSVDFCVSVDALGGFSLRYEDGGLVSVAGRSGSLGKGVD